MPPAPTPRALAAIVAALLVAQLVVVSTRSGDVPVPSVAAPPVVQDLGAAPPVPVTTHEELAPRATTSPAPSPDPVATTAAPEAAPAAPPAPSEDDSSLRPITPEEDSTAAAPPPPRRQRGPQPESAPQDPARRRFEQRFPGHAAASQNVRDPATTRWAVIVGVNDHQGGVRDNVGSRQDAEELWQHLIDLGWRQDQVLLLTDATATYELITEAIAWLARKTDEHSVAVFHYSGHTKKWYGQDADGDGEVTDEGLWPSDNRYIIDSEWVRRMSAVKAGRMWVDIGGCESAGLNDPGLERPGRILTFSSTETEKSYEDPSKRNSVWGYYLVDQALRAGTGDRNRDGNVTVEEAFNEAAPRATQRTRGQRYGAQHPVVVDHVEGDFDLRIPPPPPEPAPDEPDDDPGCTFPLCTTAPRRG